MALKPRLCDLDLPELSDESEETLRRARVFLFSIKRPEWIAPAMLAGYTPEIHQDGVYRTSLLSGERPFREWREWFALRPARDPDLPELIEKLKAFGDDWQQRALSIVRARVADDDERSELLRYIESDEPRPSRTWEAKSVIARLEYIESVPLDFYQGVWEGLCEEGFSEELSQFKSILREVQNWIRRAPLDASEMEDIQQSRERAAPLVRDWLEERRRQLAHLDVGDLTLLALGELIPPPGFEPSIDLLVGFRSGAKA